MTFSFCPFPYDLGFTTYLSLQSKMVEPDEPVLELFSKVSFLGPISIRNHTGVFLFVMIDSGKLLKCLKLCAVFALILYHVTFFLGMFYKASMATPTGS